MNNKEFIFKGTIKKGVSQKGNDYQYLDLQLIEGLYSKNVFLEKAELELLKLKNKENSDLDMPDFLS